MWEGESHSKYFGGFAGIQGGDNRRQESGNERNLKREEVGSGGRRQRPDPPTGHLSMGCEMKYPVSERGQRWWAEKTGRGVSFAKTWTSDDVNGD